MISASADPLAKRFASNETRQYWVGQFVFWFCLSVVPFLGITLWYDTVQWLYIEHMLLQAALGMAISVPLGYIYSFIWKMPLLVRMCLVLALAGGAAAAWTWARLLTYAWMTSEHEIWKEFGGWYFGAFYIFLCWSALYHGLKYYRLLELEHEQRLREVALTKEEQIKRLEAESIAREAQLKMLRYQINPHFLFNTLHAVHALIKLNDAEKATGMIGKLGGFLRYTLDYNPAQRVKLEDEITTLGLYLDIERIRFSDRLEVEFNVEDQAKCAMVPGLILQPLIENSIKYAIAASEDGGIIRINAHVVNSDLILEVIDNGPGITSPASPKNGQRSGIGLRNTRDRLHTLYKKRGSLELGSAAPSGLRITIRIPYEPAELDHHTRCNATA